MGKFEQLIQRICDRSPFQKKKLRRFLSEKSGDFFVEAEDFSAKYLGYLNKEGISIACVVDAYLKMCSDMLKSQINFMKTGHYPVSLAEDAYRNVYINEREMKSYMVGLAISQFLWPTHYAIYNFFKTHFKNNRRNILSYLEIGPGHGLFLSKALDYFGGKAGITVIDISPVSIDITKSIMKYFRPDCKNIAYSNMDILKYESKEKYDFITMGEVLEHVNNPKRLLLKLNKMLAKGGETFISTCVNSPAIDHVYHFKAVDEIKDMLGSSGFKIKRELVLPVEDLTMKEIIDKKITINYCAILKKEVSE